MAKLKDKLVGLLSVKSIVTIILTIVFSYLSVTGVIGAENFMTVFGIVIAFYFAKDKPTETVKKEG